MARLAAILTAAFQFGLATGAGAVDAEPPVRLRWANVATRYERFEDVRPSLVNLGTAPIFLSRLWPNGAARLQRLKAETGEWEWGSWGITCGTVAHAAVPIEIRPGAQRDIQVYWQLSTDRWESPRRFVAAGSGQERPVEGRYRFVLQYARQPWTLVHRPSVIHSFTSPEFELSPSKPPSGASAPLQ